MKKEIKFGSLGNGIFEQYIAQRLLIPIRIVIMMRL
jgi:hypothetical protein